MEGKSVNLSLFKLVMIGQKDAGKLAVICFLQIAVQ